MPLIPLAPAATHSPCLQSCIKDQTQDNTNEVVLAAGSSCKETRSQSFQPEGNKMLANSGQAGKERRDMAETWLMQFLCPQFWIQCLLGHSYISLLREPCLQLGFLVETRGLETAKGVHATGGKCLTPPLLGLCNQRQNTTFCCLDGPGSTRQGPNW